ncbi:DUF1513 domain-containing protein [Candidatus Halocynthiibacter alkanivorans]|uniref:DUF1513 domain-containing protein n=1 Tax=Candidatus Halocynthiibacter alkanivorans TaxID=2267619 RepID=UPI001F29FF56|nr:DUF1513 domain-containing protein [Candidatus Halocynthiibacter alkanivorans]
MDRRRFLLAAGAATVAGPSWAELGAPAFLTAASRADNSTWLVGLGAGGEVRFAVSIPSRGHAAAAHPSRSVAVAFARRPGRFAVVLDCAKGREITRLAAVEGRHFYGHGAFTRDGRYLFTTENDWENGAGVLGIWDVENGWKRVGEVASGGIGPHEIIRLPDGVFAVANGGIRTRPDSARSKLNLPDMRPNLTYLSSDGALLETVEPEPALYQNSIRHLDVDSRGQIAIASQWQGNPLQPVPLVALHRRGQALRWLDHPQTVRLKNYAGSVAIAASGDQIAVTGPRGGRVLFFDSGGNALGDRAMDGACGVAQSGGGFAITMNGGLTQTEPDDPRTIAVAGDWSWDNHLVRI